MIPMPALNSILDEIEELEFDDQEVIFGCS